MSDNEVQTQPAPEAVAPKRLRRSHTEAPPVGDVAAQLAAGPEATAAPEPALEAPLAPTRRQPSGPVLVPFDSALPGVSSADIRAELARREKRVPKLLAEHALVLEQMEAIEKALASIGEELGESAAAPAARAPRKGSGMSLKETVAWVVQPGETVSPAEVAARARASGYASTAVNLGQIVASTLAKDSRFERIGRGQYRRSP